MNDLEKAIKTARIQLFLHHPFYALLLLGLEEKWSDEPGMTCGVNTKEIIYSKWLGTLKPAELIGVMAHEASHLGLLHIPRRGKREPFVWNVATDCAVNLMLKEDNSTLPEPVVYDASYRGKTAEEIYEALMKKQQEGGGSGKSQQKQGADAGGSHAQHGFDRHDWPELTDEERKEAERQAIDNLVKAATIAKSAGKLPGQWETLVADLLQPKIDWQSRLRNFVVASAKGDYRLIPPNKRHLWRDVYLPGLKSDHLEVAVAIDTSGSITDQELQVFCSEIQGITSAFDSYRIYYYQADAAIQKETILEPGENIPRDMHGRGGTSFRPVFDKVRDLEVSCLLYLSDLCPNDGWPDPLPFPVLWVSTTDVVAPWGETIKLTVEERR